MTRRQEASSDLALYTQCCQHSAARVIADYSTSFGAALQLLAAPLRAPIANIYALVRTADELVDGAATEAGLSVTQQRELLDALEADTFSAIGLGYSTNLVVHAFAATAREAGIAAELIRPFFASMRRDLVQDDLDAAGVDEYIHGSAEVVGLMCLRVFLAADPVEADVDARLQHGARRLGAAFQKVNFLRDLAADWEGLGRNYFPDLQPGAITEEQKQSLLEDIDADLQAASAVIAELPRGCRKAVAAAHGLFFELARRLRATPARELLQERVRVPAPVKARIVLESALRAGR